MVMIDRKEKIWSDTDKTEIEKKKRLLQLRARIQEEKEQKRAEREREILEKREQLRTEREQRKRRIAEEKRRRISMQKQKKEMLKTSKTAKELGIESIEGTEKAFGLKTLKDRKEKTRIIPTKKATKVIAKETTMSIKKGLGGIAEKVRRGIRGASDTTGQAIKKQIVLAQIDFKRKMEQEKAFKRRLKGARREARFSAEVSKIRKEERMKAGLIPRGNNIIMGSTRGGMSQTRRTGLPLFEPKERGSKPIFEMGKSNSGLNIFEFKKRRKK